MNSLRAKLLERAAKQKLRSIIQLHSLSSQVLIDPSIQNEQKIEIKIPKKIERGSTDILQALESTVSRDPTAPHYKFIDDPYLIPTSLSKKRMYSLAREAGRKAALWIKQQHPDLLYSKLSEPLIEAFLPEEAYDKPNNVSEEVLKRIIKDAKIEIALRIYIMLEKKVSLETKQDLLELLCFYNNAKEISEQFLEERSYQAIEEPTKNMWINNPEIDLLFNELIANDKTAPAAFNTLICGMAKHLKSDKTWELYMECQEKAIPITLETYNYLISLIPLVKESTEERKLLLKFLLLEMAKNKIKPNVKTLNFSLKVAMCLTSNQSAKQLALSIINEFKSIGIEPCLGSYEHLLTIFCREVGHTSRILEEILDDLEQKESINVEDTLDTSFFVHAMEVANKHLHDLAVGDRVHRLLTKNRNYRFIGGRLKEGIYYRHYMLLMLSSETLEEFMKVYDNIVPHVYIPEAAVMKEIILMLQLNEAHITKLYLPRLLSDIVTFDMLDRFYIMVSLFKLMCDLSKEKEDPNLQKQFTEFSSTLWSHMKELSEKQLQRSMWPVSVFADMAILFIRGEQFEKMLEVFEYVMKSPGNLTGCIKNYRLEEMLSGCIIRGHSVGAMMIVEYAFEWGIEEAGAMARKVYLSLPLTENEESKLNSLTGSALVDSEGALKK